MWSMGIIYVEMGWAPRYKHVEAGPFGIGGKIKTGSSLAPLAENTDTTRPNADRARVGPVWPRTQKKD